VKRWCGGKGIGFEPTLKQYIANLVAIFREARRGLKDDGVTWIVVGDSYATSGNGGSRTATRWADHINI
jgi:hypothetical protein